MLRTNLICPKFKLLEEVNNLGNLMPPIMVGVVFSRFACESQKVDFNPKVDYGIVLS